MSTMKQLLEAFNNAKTREQFPIVRFTPRIEEYLETYFDRGMKARVISIREEDKYAEEEGGIMYEVAFDFSEFDEFNKPYEQANYWDGHGEASLTASESGWKPKDSKDTVYFMELGDEENSYFEIIDQNFVTLTVSRNDYTTIVDALDFTIIHASDINFIDLIKVRDYLKKQM